MIFPLPSEKNYDLLPQSIIFSLVKVQWKYNFFTQKDVEMPHLYIFLYFAKNIIHYLWQKNLSSVKDKNRKK